MKRSELLFNIFSLPLDACMLLLAAWASFSTRVHSTTLVGPVQYRLVLHDFLLTAISVLPVVLLIFAALGLYNIRGARQLFAQLGRIILGVSMALFLVMILFFFNNQLFPSRFIILAAWGYGILLVFAGRILLQQLQQVLFRYGRGLHYVVIVNGANTDSQIIQDSLVNPKWGLRVIKELSHGPNVLAELESLYANTHIDEIIQANPTLSDQQNWQLLEFARSKGLAYSYVPSMFDVQRNVREVFDYNGVVVISIRNTPLDGWGKVAKRTMDVVLSLLAMLVLSPVYLAVYLAVKMDSSGPAIYAYLRGGMGKDFMFYKFRSMYTHLSNGLGGDEANKVREELWKKNDRGGAESPFLKIKNDPRITRVGRIIRKTKLDELPQFWNVLKGDMSLVGPRAHMIDEVNLYRDKYRRMFSIRPGIFGLSQNAQMLWPDLPFEEEVKLVTYYIENWSLWLDIKILFKTVYLIFFAPKPKEDY